MSSLRWWVLAAAAALVVLVATVLLAQQADRGGTKPGPAEPTKGPTPAAVAAPAAGGPRAASALASDGGGPCPDAALLPGRALPGAEAAAMVLAGDAQVRFTVDGEAPVGTPDAPPRFSAGAHALRVEAPGAEPLELTLKVHAFRPGLVEARVDGAVMTAVVLGASCASCEAGQGDVDVRYDAKSKRAAPLDDAAAALRTGDWRRAAEALRAVKDKERKAPRFLRQRAATEAFAGLPSRARETLAGLKGPEAGRLPGLLASHAKLEESEAAREAQVAVRRWNLLTERYARLADRFGKDAPGPVGSAQARFDKLSAGFSKAAQVGDVVEEQAMVDAAEESLRALVRELRGSNPHDCAWQAKVTAAQ